MPRTEPPAATVARDPHWSAKMDRLRQRKPLEAYVTITLDDQAKTAASKAEMDLAAARARVERQNGKADEKHPEVVKARKAAEAAQGHLTDSTIKLGFRSLPRDVYESLMADHPPAPDQEAKGEVFNLDTFPAALVAACSIDGMPLEDAQELLNNWNQSEAAALFQAAQYVNTMSRLELGKG